MKKTAAAALAGVLGALASLLVLGNSRVPIAGLLLCPPLLILWPAFDQFPEMSDGLLWTLTTLANAIVYASVARCLAAFRFRRGTSKRG